MSEVYRLQLVERPNRLVETRAIGYAHATVPLPLGLDDLAGLLADGAFARVGQELYAVLFPEGEVRDSLAEALVVTRAERRPLTVQLHLDPESPTLARYPWELIHDGQSFLVADGAVALARYIDYAQALVPATVQAPLRLLLVSPRPVDLAGADERPCAALLGALEPLRQQGRLQVDLLSPPTYAALRDVLSREPYQALHFDGPSGYGRVEGPEPQPYLVFEDEHAAAFPVTGATLYNALFLSRVRLATLVPPWPDRPPDASPPGPTALAALAPALVKAGVPAVLAMQYALAPEQNERFAAQLYRSLAERAPLATAVAHARGQLVPPESTRFAPALYLQDKEGTGELFVGAAEPAAPRAVAYVPSAPGPISSGYHPDAVFVDRAQPVIQTLQALAGAMGRVCLWGFGGVGKTAVAREVVRRGAWRFPGGVVWLSLQGGPSLAAVLGEVAAACGMDKVPPLLEDAARQVTAALAEHVGAVGEMLLVLDNLEDAAGDADLAAFVAGLPTGVRALATSRSEPAAEAWQAIELGVMGAADIERILRQKARAQRVAVAAADEPLLAEISALLDGYPLGVDLVVTLARTCPWAHIRDELRAQPPPPLQAMLRTTIAEALGDEERRAAARLSVMRGPFGEAAIARLTGTNKWLPQVQRLREMALISFDGANYAFDVPIREYLYSLLGPDEARECHELAYRYFAGRRDLDGQVEAYHHAMAGGQHRAARELLRKLLDPLLNAGRYHQLLGLVDGALATPEAFDERFLLARAGVQRVLGRLPEALQSLHSLAEVPDLTVSSRALALHEQGRIYYELDDEERSDHQRALDLFAQALGIYDDLDSNGTLDRPRRRALDAELATLFQDVGTVYQYALARPEDLAFARRLYAASAGLWQRLRDPVSRAKSEMQRAQILRLGSPADKAEAKRIYRQVMQTFRRKGLERAYGDALLQLGKIYQDERGLKHALKRFQEYEEIQRRLGLEREEAIAWKQQGEIHQEAGYRGRSAKQAVDLYGRALERLARYADRWSRRTVLATLLRRGEALLELGQVAEAKRDFREALQRSVAMGTRRGEFDAGRLSETDRQRLVWAHCALAHIQNEGEEVEAGGDLAEAALATWRSLGQNAVDLTAPDCNTALSLPGWAMHHRKRKGKVGVH